MRKWTDNQKDGNRQKEEVSYGERQEKKALVSIWTDNQKHSDRQTETDRQTERQTDRQKERSTVLRKTTEEKKATDGQMKRQSKGQKQTNRQKEVVSYGNDRGKESSSGQMDIYLVSETDFLVRLQTLKEDLLRHQAAKTLA